LIVAYLVAGSQLGQWHTIRFVATSSPTCHLRGGCARALHVFVE
jgi:hypothetical protein